MPMRYFKKLQASTVSIWCWFLWLLPALLPSPKEFPHLEGRYDSAMQSKRSDVRGGTTQSHLCGLCYAKNQMFFCVFCLVLVLSRCVCILIHSSLWIPSYVEVLWPSCKKKKSWFSVRNEHTDCKPIPILCLLRQCTPGNTKCFTEVGVIWYLRYTGVAAVLCSLFCWASIPLSQKWWADTAR